MTPAARIQAAIEILRAVTNTAQPIDRFLRNWFRTRRYAGAKDRAAIAERVYDVFRHHASYAWRMRSADPRALVIASCSAEASSPDFLERIFAGGGYGPAPLDDAERHAIAEPPQSPPPLFVQGEFPAWLEPELVRSLGPTLLPEMQALSSRAPIDLRANALKATQEEVLGALRSAGFEANPTRFAPNAIRLSPVVGLSALQNTESFRNGLFEFQDEGSQLVAHLVDAKPGERVLDYAVGAGGKALALAAAMRNQGEIIAFDRFPERMRPLSERAERAGATIIVAVGNDITNLAPQSFDAVLVDVPCSGSGTWRRNPDAKWRLTADALAHYKQTQAALLDSAARLVKRDGRLVYATCSILCSENEDAVENFLSRNRGFARISVKCLWPRVFSAQAPPGTGNDFRASPLKTGTDGFFASIMRIAP
jgi:16S rRNA (cytosine967-C5)-methyltransferase